MSGSSGRAIFRNKRGWTGLLLRWLAGTAFFWIVLWAFMWPTGKHALVAAKGTIVAYEHRPAAKSPEKAVYVIRTRSNEREFDRSGWIRVNTLDPARKLELPRLLGRDVEAQIGFGDEIYGFRVGGDPADRWFAADATIAAKWAEFVGALKVTAGIALFLALISSLDAFRRKSA